MFNIGIIASYLTHADVKLENFSRDIGIDRRFLEGENTEAHKRLDFSPVAELSAGFKASSEYTLLVSTSFQHSFVNHNGPNNFKAFHKGWYASVSLLRNISLK